MKSKYRLYAVRGLIYLLGLFTIAVGVALSKRSELGVSPVNAIPCVLSYILDVDIGICTTAVFFLFIVIQIFIMRREFKIKNLLQIIPSFIFGFFVSASNQLCCLIIPPCTSYIMQALYLVISLFFIAAGLYLYLEADILSMPGEGVMQAVAYKTGIKLSNSKIIFDAANVIIAAVLSLIFLQELAGVREGTVAAAIGVGFVLKFVSKALRKPVSKLLKKESNLT